MFGSYFTELEKRESESKAHWDLEFMMRTFGDSTRLISYLRLSKGSTSSISAREANQYARCDAPSIKLFFIRPILEQRLAANLKLLALLQKPKQSLNTHNCVQHLLLELTDICIGLKQAKEACRYLSEAKTLLLNRHRITEKL